nr:putative reverse transcriptase domain-containing protein [Tanacetum cinerariifolium]
MERCYTLWKAWEVKSTIYSAIQEIMDREVKRLKQSQIPIVKVRWNSRRGPEFTWERDDFFKIKNGSIKKVEKRGNMGEPRKDKSGKDANKGTRIGNVFVTTMNPIGRENTGNWPKCSTCNSYHATEGPCRTCFNGNRPSHLEKDRRGVPRNVNHVNARNPPVKA